MEKKMNVKALIGIFLFCFGATASNMTMGIMAYISQSYADSPQAVIQTILVTPSLVSVVYALFVGKLNTKIPAKMLVIFHQIAILAYGLIFLLLGGTASIYVLIVGADVYKRQPDVRPGHEGLCGGGHHGGGCRHDPCRGAGGGGGRHRPRGGHRGDPPGRGQQPYPGHQGGGDPLQAQRLTVAGYSIL